MIFYRMQSYDYDVNENSRSFVTCFGSLEEAMEEDLKEKIMEIESPGTFINECFEENINNEELAEKLETVNDIYWKDYDKYVVEMHKLWEEEIENSSRVHDGISCYEEDRKEELEQYRKMHEEEYNNHYILVFEGEYTETGLDGEDIAIFRKEIEKLSRYKNI